METTAFFFRLTALIKIQINALDTCFDQSQVSAAGLGQPMMRPVICQDISSAGLMGWAGILPLASN